MALLQLVKNPKNLKAVTLAVTASQDEVSQFIEPFLCWHIQFLWNFHSGRSCFHFRRRRTWPCLLFSISSHDWSIEEGNLKPLWYWISILSSSINKILTGHYIVLCLSCSVTLVFNWRPWVKYVNHYGRSVSGWWNVVKRKSSGYLDHQNNHIPPLSLILWWMFCDPMWGASIWKGI